jgi:aspartyl aminopeptidase
MKKTLGAKEIEKLKSMVEKKQSLVWDSLDNNEKNGVIDFCENYKNFLSSAKTERQAVTYIVNESEKNGFVNIDQAKKPHDKYYRVYKNKSVGLWVKGALDMVSGLRIIGSHMDSPRLDLKQNPLYEEVDIALMKTHYYGGIKKYHWLARPLSIHGVVMLKDGSCVNIALGENDEDPVFCKIGKAHV